jgi:hypothetical protein
MSKHNLPIQLYAEQMREIKRRIEVIDFYLFKGGHAMYKPTTTESICLQFRKILELIAFSSLIANKPQYSAVHKNFETHWNAELLLKDLNRVNPDFYPKPIEEKPSAALGVENELPPILLSPILDGYLTQDDFIHIYKKCGGMLHALNPYGSKTGYDYFEKSFPEWRKKLIRLLNSHEVHLVGQTSFWLFHMKENGDDNVHYYEFELVEEDK